MQSVVFRALVPAVQPLPLVSADDTLAPFQATRRDACRPRLPFLAGSALTDSVWVFFSTQHGAVLCWVLGATPTPTQNRLETGDWVLYVRRDFYSTQQLSPLLVSASLPQFTNRLFKGFVLEHHFHSFHSFHSCHVIHSAFTPRSSWISSIPVLQTEFSRTNTHTHARTRRLQWEIYTLI